MSWAKLHTDILGDPKLMRAARKGAKGLEFLPWIIAFAKQADDDGRLSIGGEPADAVDLAQLIPGATPKTLRNCLISLENIGVLVRDSSDFLRFSAWEHRSGTKPSDAPSAVAGRVARHRAAKSLQAKDKGNASNALHVTRDNATEKRREEEKREEERRGERSGADAPPAATALPAWLPGIRARWQVRVGRITPAVLSREISAAIDLHGEPAILLAIDAYAEERIEQGKPMKLEWFAAECAAWVERAKPIVDADGILTERGIAALGGR